MGSTTRGSLYKRRATFIAVALFVLAQASATSTISTAHITASPANQTPPPQPSLPILLTDPVPDPKQVGVQWFSPTGHTLRGAFLDYWQKNGGLAQFGYPITEEFTEPGPGPENKPLDVQYFERNRFEHHSENQPPNAVLLGLLGTSFHTSDPPALPLPNAQYFTETGHNLSGVFKQYWQMHGGLAIHGYPISEQLQETNPIDHKVYTVQYFQRTRMELHPENAGSPYEVLLGMLGTQLAQKRGYAYGWYPAFGHAADFSWIAGEMRIYGIPGTTGLWAGCSIFAYGEGDARVQLAGWPYDVPKIGGPFLRQGAVFVVFGYFTKPGDTYTICPRDRKAPSYLVTRLQGNPVK